MFRTGMIVAGAALLLGSSLVAADASAGNKAGQKKLAAKAGGKKSAKSGNLSSPSANGNNIGMSGPYIGLKYIGNVP